MASGLRLQSIRPCAFSLSSSHVSACRWYVTPSTRNSSAISLNVPRREVPAIKKTEPAIKKTEPALSLLPAPQLLRSYVLSRIFASDWAFKCGLAVIQTITNSNSRLLNPDINPILRFLIKPLIYDQFCAGRNEVETRAGAVVEKQMGTSGIIVAYAKEVELDETRTAFLSQTRSAGPDPELDEWERGVLQTLSMTQSGDLMAIKVTGAGWNVMRALVKNEPPPSTFLDALDTICQQSKTQNTRLIVDAEQQAVQPAIERIAIDLMRKWNTENQPLIYNTVQAYLKSSKVNVANQLRLAKAEGWSVGIKLVRGAYIASDRRELIHDTKEQTDASYNGIVRALLSGKVEGVDSGGLPNYELILAGHNPDSIRKACSLAKELASKGALKVDPEFAQLQGMANDLACELVQAGQKAKAEQSEFVPRLYKYLVWGSLRECMQYLVRRAIENQSAAVRMREGYMKYGQELRRRIFSRLRLTKSE